MKKLDDIIQLVHDIDANLDAYDYKGYTYAEYKELKEHNDPGGRSLRHMIHNGSHIWNGISDTAIINTKSVINDLYRGHINKDDIKNAIIQLDNGIKHFKKHTDDYSIYPLQSDTIGAAMETIKQYFSELIS